MENKEKENMGWVDLLRIIACFLVVLSHSCDPFIAVFDKDRATFLTGAFAGSMVRCCVPLFVMMTGVLLLPVHVDMKEFYKKRIGRIVIPLAFWSMALPILFFVYLNYIHTGTSNPMIAPADHTWNAVVQLQTYIFNFKFASIPLWYLYMLLGLYLMMPVISGWLRQATKQNIELFLKIWGFTLFLPYIKLLAPLMGYTGNYGNMGLLGVCDWNEYGTFYYFSGFIGYLVLAYYLVKYPLKWSWKRMLSITVPLFTVGYLITSFGYVFIQNHFPGNYAYLEIVWYFAGINVFMMTFSVFAVVQKLNTVSSRRLSRLAGLTFGIYLCHFVIVQAAYDFFDVICPLPTGLHIAAIACSTFAVSWGVAWVMSRWTMTRRLIM